MASFKFKNVYLDYSSSISSQNEKINTKFTLEDYFEGEKTSEASEVKMQKRILNDLASYKPIDLVIGADLSNQLGITNQTMSNFKFPYIGIYNACTSYVEGLILSATILQSSRFRNAVTLVSSHNLDAERTFRYPIEYGSPMRATQTFTATACTGSIVTKDITHVKLESCTIGKVIDYGINDVNNMGAIMAPGAADTLITHLKDTKRDIGYYDLILTGDLGKLGSELFVEILSRNDITLKRYIDAGSILITDKELTLQGGSGPVCLPLVLTEKILKDKKYKKILIIGTGALHNITLVNQKKTIPSLSHAVSLEVL